MTVSPDAVPTVSNQTIQAIVDSGCRNLEIYDVGEVDFVLAPRCLLIDSPHIKSVQFAHVIAGVSVTPRMGTELLRLLLGARPSADRILAGEMICLFEDLEMPKHLTALCNTLKSHDVRGCWWEKNGRKIENAMGSHCDPSAKTFADLLDDIAARLYGKSDCANVTLVTDDGGETLGHLEILIARSKSFWGLVNTDEYKKTSRVNMGPMSHVTLDALLRWVYTRTITTTNCQDLVDLLGVAMSRGEFDLIDATEDALKAALCRMSPEERIREVMDMVVMDTHPAKEAWEFALRAFEKVSLLAIWKYAEALRRVTV